jgi:hypothetical protein
MNAEINEQEPHIDEESFNKMREERQREVDLLSLELLSNSKNYKKYIAKKCPEEQMKRVEYANRFLKYKSRIASLFIDLLDEYERDDEDEEGYESSSTSEINSIFKEFVQKSIQHLEWTEYSNTENSNANEFDDEDIMFATTKKKSDAKKRRTYTEDPYSFWGATIRKSDANELSR